MCRNLGVGMQGKAMHAGTAGDGQGQALTLDAKARAKATNFLTRSFTKGNALLH
jgi:hypothetical protein